MADTPPDDVIETALVTRPVTFDLSPDAEARAELAQSLGILGIRKLTFGGEVHPLGDVDIELEAKLGATVVQACVATLEPVVTRIDIIVLRRFVADLPEPEADEAEMPEDDTVEPLSQSIHLSDILSEALSLALPDFPRAADAPTMDFQATEPGKTPMSDDDAKPFAGLRSLRDKLAGDGDENS